MCETNNPNSQRKFLKSIRNAVEILDVGDGVTVKNIFQFIISTQEINQPQIETFNRILKYIDSSKAKKKLKYENGRVYWMGKNTHCDVCGRYKLLPKLTKKGKGPRKCAWANKTKRYEEGAEIKELKGTSKKSNIKVKKKKKVVKCLTNKAMLKIVSRNFKIIPKRLTDDQQEHLEKQLKFSNLD